MKKIIAIIVSLLFVLSVAGLSLAAEKKEAAPAPAAKEEKKVDEQKPEKKTHHYVHGEVTAVDAVAKTLTVKGKKGEVTLTVDDKTKFHKGKTLADLKVGDKLGAKYKDVDGKMVATRIKTKKHHHDAKKEMKPEEKKEEKK